MANHNEIFPPIIVSANSNEVAKYMRRGSVLAPSMMRKSNIKNEQDEMEELMNQVNKLYQDVSILYWYPPSDYNPNGSERESVNRDSSIQWRQSIAGIRSPSNAS